MQNMSIEINNIWECLRPNDKVVTKVLFLCAMNEIIDSDVYTRKSELIQEISSLFPRLHFLSFPTILEENSRDILSLFTLFYVYRNRGVQYVFGSAVLGYCSRRLKPFSFDCRNLISRLAIGKSHEKWLLSSSRASSYAHTNAPCTRTL